MLEEKGIVLKVTVRVASKEALEKCARALQNAVPKVAQGMKARVWKAWWVGAGEKEAALKVHVTGMQETVWDFQPVATEVIMKAMGSLNSNRRLRELGCELVRVEEYEDEDDIVAQRSN